MAAATPTLQTWDRSSYSSSFSKSLEGIWLDDNIAKTNTKQQNITTVLGAQILIIQATDLGLFFVLFYVMPKPHTTVGNAQRQDLTSLGNDGSYFLMFLCRDCEVNSTNTVMMQQS